MNPVVKFLKINLKNEKSKGITLIALVITIIVLLILAGVTISAISGDNGILKNAIKAKEETRKAEIIDLARSDVLAKITEKKGESLNELELENILLEYGNLSSEENIFDRILTTEDGYTIPVSEIYTDTLSNGENTQLPGNDDTSPYLPDQSSTILEGTNLDNGLVVIDANRNEWVWIEVPRNIYKDTKYNGGQEITSAEGEENLKNIEKTMQNYAADYRRDGWEDIYFAGCGVERKEKYDELKNKMLKSVFENGGFWIGRYEAGADKVFNEDDETPRILKVQKDMFTYNFVTAEEAQNLSSNLITDSSKTCSLMFGIQWELVCKFIEIKQIKTEDNKLIDHSVIAGDSKDIGNYIGSKFEITSENAQISEDEGESYTKIEKGTIKENVDGILLTTGASEKNKVLNIYDLAGNQYEYTLQANVEKQNSSVRGGNYRGDSSKYISSFNYITVNSKKDNISFRPTIF